MNSPSISPSAALFSPKRCIAQAAPASLSPRHLSFISILLGRRGPDVASAFTRTPSGLRSQGLAPAGLGEPAF